MTSDENADETALFARRNMSSAFSRVERSESGTLGIRKCHLPLLNDLDTKRGCRR